MLNLINICDITLVNILVKYIDLINYGNFEISISNKNMHEYFKKLTTKNSFIMNTNENKYEKYFKNNNFLNWLILKNININKLFINGNKILNYYYISKTSLFIKSIMINNMTTNLNYVTFDNLEKIEIKNNTFNNYELFNITKCKNLQSLVFLENSNINNIIKFVSENTNSLQKLSIGSGIKYDGYKQINLSDTTLINIINKCKNLCSIKLCNCYLITDYSMIKLIENCELENLSLYNCHNITDKFILEICKKDNGLKIKKLKLFNCKNISDKSMINVGDKCKNLEILKLACCTEITYNTINNIAKNCIKLTKIDITQNNNENHELYINSLCKLINNCKELKHVYLGIIVLIPEHIILFEALLKLKNLEILSLYGQTSDMNLYDNEFEIKINNALTNIITSPKIKLVFIDISLNLIYTMNHILNSLNHEKRMICKFYTNCTKKKYLSIIIEVGVSNQLISYQNSDFDIFSAKLIMT